MDMHLNLKETTYKNYMDAQSGNRDRIAIFTTHGEEITHGRLMEEIDEIAASITVQLEGKPAKIGVLSISEYQEAVFFMAASKIGAVSKFVDYNKNIPDIERSISESSLSLLVMSEVFLQIEPLINPQNLPVVVLGENAGERGNCISYKDFLKTGINHTVTTAPYRHQTPSVIINSSGTTGLPKPIVISDYAINNAIENMIGTDLPLDQGNILIKVVPCFIGMGLIITLYLGLVLGMPLLYVGGSGPEESMKNFILTISRFDGFRRQHHLSESIKACLFASPMFYRVLYEMREIIPDLSYMGCMLAGGSAMSKEELEIFDDEFQRKGCTVPIINGYGQNEMVCTITLNQNNDNCRGSAGKTLNGVDLQIVDTASMKPLPRGKQGTILERSETAFLCYENMDEKTKAAFYTDEEGNRWFNTHDTGFLNEEGFLFITGRNSRAMIRFDMKVSLDHIEGKLRKSKYLKDVAVVLCGKDRLVAFLVLYQEYKESGIGKQEILEDIKNGPEPLTDLETLNELVILETMPISQNGKTDYKVLEKMTEETV